MSLDNIKGSRRKKLIGLGLRWGSSRVREQANAIIGQLRDHQPTLEAHGLLLEDVAELVGWVALYPEKLDEREVKRLGNSLTSLQLRALMTDAETARRVARLRLAEAELRLDPDAGEAAEALLHVQAVLEKTSRKPKDDPEALASQLRRLADALALPVVMDVARVRGGEAALAALGTAEKALSEAVAVVAQRTSTTALTERLDLIDGLIIERLREITRIAKEAAKAVGSPALHEAFRLKLLYTR
jgi:hypothetical protein